MSGWRWLGLGLASAVLGLLGGGAAASVQAGFAAQHRSEVGARVVLGELP